MGLGEKMIVFLPSITKENKKKDLEILKNYVEEKPSGSDSSEN